ncbi:hypothetical protein [Actinomadura sp. GTD37]|uniref:hypothetical protein n=1 Tax=Actinomadura sp. GTD37 TaxID=1778030 RepID=UPI0035BFE243
MAEKTAPTGPSANVRGLAGRKAPRECRIHRVAACTLVLVGAMAAVAVVQSFVPRGHRGRRRLRRTRPWHRRPGSPGAARPRDAADEPRT